MESQDSPFPRKIQSMIILLFTAIEGAEGIVKKHSAIFERLLNSIYRNFELQEFKF